MGGETHPVFLFEEFAGRVTIVTGQNASAIRACYIARFVDTTTTYYREHISYLTHQSDGLAYSGYLWDTFACGRQIPESEIYAEAALDETVGAFWDLHSADKIWTPNGNYWRFPKEAVITLPYRDLLAGREYLTDDLYIFDLPMSWTLVFTHEWDAKDQRIYLKVP